MTGVFEPLTAISADGRYVAFASDAPDLVPWDRNEQSDVFVHDRVTGITERVSVGAEGAEGDAFSGQPAISGDGRYVAFLSASSNLLPGESNATQAIFVRDRLECTTERVSVATDGTAANDWSQGAAVNADGRYVAFHSFASNLVPGDDNGDTDVFVHDRQTGDTERISVAANGSQGNSFSFSPTISADGRFVAFDSDASNLVPADTTGGQDLGVYDVFLRDRQTGRTERVSVSSAGAEVAGDSWLSKISADGRYVVFWSNSSSLVPGDGNGKGDIFVRDRLTGAVQRVSVTQGGLEANAASQLSAISGDGRYVVFDSFASNLVPGDTNGAWDIFVRDRGPAVGVGGLSAAAVGDRVEVSGWATFEGSVPAFAADPGNDGQPGAREAGGELLGASLVHRPELGDLVARLDLADLPSPLTPGLVYGMQLEVGGARYEIRGSHRVGAVQDIGLYRCEAACLRVATLTGGIGTAGKEVHISLPLDAVGATPDSVVAGVRGFTAVGDTAAVVRPMDDVVLADVTIATPRVALAIAPSGTPEDRVVFDTAAEMSGGAFSGSLGTSGLPPGEYEVWARACLGETCGSTSLSV